MTVPAAQELMGVRKSSLQRQLQGFRCAQVQHGCQCNTAADSATRLPIATRLPVQHGCRLPSGVQAQHACKRRPWGGEGGIGADELLHQVAAAAGFILNLGNCLGNAEQMAMLQTGSFGLVEMLY
jgi:hypothetical protein